MFDIQYLMSEWHDKSAILPSGLKHVLICLCWGFTAQSTQLGHVERGQFT